MVILKSFIALIILLSPDFSVAAPSSASSLRYQNSTGLRDLKGKPARTIQQAIDGLSSQVKNLLSKKSSTALGATTQEILFSGKVFSLFGNGTDPVTSVNEESVIVTFTPDSNDQLTGQWSSQPVNIFSPSAALLGDQNERGTWSGSYRIIGNHLFAFNQLKPDGSHSTYSAVPVIDTQGNELNITNTSSMPPTLVKLTRQTP